jgi:RimJ/RimL family protein N-acetyltransferase
VPPLTFPIRTERLELRPFIRADIDGFFAYWSLPEVARYVPWLPGDRVQATLALERRMGDVRLEQPGDILVLAVVERAHQGVIGEMMLRWFEGEHEQGEIGFAIHPAFHGQGLAGEAAAAVLALGFSRQTLAVKCRVEKVSTSRARSDLRSTRHFTARVWREKPRRPSSTSASPAKPWP